MCLLKATFLFVFLKDSRCLLKRILLIPRAWLYHSCVQRQGDCGDIGRKSEKAQGKKSSSSWIAMHSSGSGDCAGGGHDWTCARRQGTRPVKRNVAVAAESNSALSSCWSARVESRWEYRREIEKKGWRGPVGYPCTRYNSARTIGTNRYRLYLCLKRVWKYSHRLYYVDRDTTPTAFDLEAILMAVATDLVEHAGWGGDWHSEIECHLKYTVGVNITHLTVKNK